jgi:hypothetical protein
VWIHISTLSEESHGRSFTAIRDEGDGLTHCKVMNELIVATENSNLF